MAVTRFPSPLGVLGLTTACHRLRCLRRSGVSVPSRGFGSDDTPEPRHVHGSVFKFPSPLGVLGLTTRRVLSQRRRPRYGFPSPLGVLGLTTR